MKKRVFALLLSAVLCFGLVGTAFAVYIDETGGNGIITDDTTTSDPTPDPDPAPAPDPGTSSGSGSSTWKPPYIPVDSSSDSGTAGTTPSQPDKEPEETPDKTPDEAPDETPSAPVMPFVDVNAGDWFHDAVQYVFEKGIMTGDGSTTTFNPRGNMTRAMVWTVLGRLSGADVSGAGSTWYAKAQSWAVSNGISDGTNPNGSITREELVTMLWRYAGSPAASADLSVFSDSASVSSWANAAMQWAVSTGILAGENGRLNPRSSATRAEVAMILMRYCEIIAA